MYKQKIFFLFLGFIFGIVAGYFFAQWQYRANMGFPLAGFPCDQSATTTDCLKLLTQLEPGTTPPPTKPDTATTTPFTFGPLINIYEDEEFGFLLKYPDEIRSSKNNTKTYIELKDHAVGWFSITLCNPHSGCLKNPQAQSLNDYSRDYIVSSKESGHLSETGKDMHYAVRILESTYITTLSGIQGMKQRYSSREFYVETGMERRDPGYGTRDWVDTRYVFYSPTKGAYILSLNGESNAMFSELEKRIIDTVEYR